MDSPEAPPAGILRRLLAFTIDVLCLSVVFAAARLGLPEQLAAMFVAWAAAFRCRTPGRWFAGVAVVRCDGTDPGVIRCGLRAIGYALSALPLALGFVLAAFGSKRALHDRLAGTRVVRSPAGTPLTSARVLAGVACAGLAAAIVGESGRVPTEPFEALPTTAIEARSLPDGKLAMSAYMLTGSERTDADWRIALRRMRAMGVQLVEIGQIAWTDIEREPGLYEWGYAQRVLAINEDERLGLEFAADIAMFINPGLNGVPKLPAHLEGRRFDDPELVRALGALYVAFLRLPGARRVTYLLQHFENADVSLEARPDDVARVQSLLRESFALARRERPDLRTGVCVQSYRKPHFSPGIIRRWNVEVGTDIVPLISFGPSEFESEGEVGDTEKELIAALTAAEGRTIALNECGHHSHPSSGSNPALQAAFVRALFAALSRHHDRIAFATWYEYLPYRLMTATPTVDASDWTEIPADSL